MIRIFPVTKMNILYWKWSIPQPELNKYREKIERKTNEYPDWMLHTLKELLLVFSENSTVARVTGLLTLISLALRDSFMERSDNWIILYKDSALRYEIRERKGKIRKRIQDLPFSVSALLELPSEPSLANTYAFCFPCRESHPGK